MMKVGDWCLGKLANLSSLEHLSVAVWSCSAGGLKQISRLTALHSLRMPLICNRHSWLSGTHATRPERGLKFRDSSLRFLCKLTRLHTLDVSRMGVDGASAHCGPQRMFCTPESLSSGSFLSYLNPTTLRELRFDLPRGDGQYPSLFFATFVDGSPGHYRTTQACQRLE